MTELWTVDCAGATHVGKVRSTNEDAWLARPEAGLFAVADGMGGHRRGDLASRMVVDALAALPPAPDARTMREQVETALVTVNRELQPAKGEDVSGSTVVAVLLYEQHFAVLWAGDSRLYRAGLDGLMRMTRDHSIVQSLIDRGGLAPEAAGGHPMASSVTRAVGVAPELVLDGMQAELRAGDVFMLCTDGLTRHVGDGEIQTALESLTPQAAADHLIAMTLDRGARDNVTVVVLKLEQLTDRPLPPLSSGKNASSLLGEAS